MAPPTEKTSDARISGHGNGKWPRPWKMCASTICSAISASVISDSFRLRMPTTATASISTASGLAAQVSAASRAKSHRRRVSSAGSANATPSMNGYAPEIVYAPQTTANVTRRGLPATRSAKAAAPTAIDRTASGLIPTIAASG